MVRSFVVRWLARHGVGGFYHYVIQENAWTFATKSPSVSGPYRTLEAAQGPLWGARLYFRQEWVRFHFRCPTGATDPSVWDLEVP
jgi:hypothetical protein